MYSLSLVAGIKVGPWLNSPSFLSQFSQPCIHLIMPAPIATKQTNIFIMTPDDSGAIIRYTGMTENQVIPEIHS
jgi:hypothetical protein